MEGKRNETVKASSHNSLFCPGICPWMDIQPAKYSGSDEVVAILSPTIPRGDLIPACPSNLRADCSRSKQRPGRDKRAVTTCRHLARQSLMVCDRLWFATVHSDGVYHRVCPAGWPSAPTGPEFSLAAHSVSCFLLFDD